jgi:Uma2 family endonuclease
LICSTGIPALIIEVLSPNNPTYDTVIKHRAYAGAGVPEYWIIRPAMQNVLVCSQPDTQLRDYAHTFVVGIEETLISPTLPIQTPVANLFIGLPDSTPGGA